MTPSIKLHAYCEAHDKPERFPANLRNERIPQVFPRTGLVMQQNTFSYETDNMKEPRTHWLKSGALMTIGATCMTAGLAIAFLSTGGLLIGAVPLLLLGVFLTGSGAMLGKDSFNQTFPDGFSIGHLCFWDRTNNERNLGAVQNHPIN